MDLKTKKIAQWSITAVGFIAALITIGNTSIKNPVFPLLLLLMLIIFTHFGGTIMPAFLRAVQKYKPVGVWRTIRTHPCEIRTNFSDYTALVSLISETAGDFLLWTLNLSPTDVDPSKLNSETQLSDYDEKFVRFYAKKKIRLVVFPDREKAEEYSNIQLNGNYADAKKQRLQSRKAAFEKAHDRKDTYLLFTIRGLLDRFKGKKPLSETESKRLYYDMAYISTGREREDGLVFYSPFVTGRDYPHHHCEDNVLVPNKCDSSKYKDAWNPLVTFYASLACDLHGCRDNNVPHGSPRPYAFKSKDIDGLIKEYDERPQQKELSA